MNHFIVVREDVPGKFIAYPAGLPELTVHDVTRGGAIERAWNKLNEMHAQGNLVSLPVAPLPKPSESDWEIEARAEMQRAFEETIERSRREDLERTLAEYEADCPSTSSTPTI